MGITWSPPMSQQAVLKRPSSLRVMAMFLFEMTVDPAKWLKLSPLAAVQENTCPLLRFIVNGMPAACPTMLFAGLMVMAVLFSVAMISNEWVDGGL